MNLNQNMSVPDLGIGNQSADRSMPLRKAP
jgi:hypothetical protein